MFVVKLNATGTNIIGSACVAGSKYDAVNMEDQLNQENGPHEVCQCADQKLWGRFPQ